jgi:hypothetical protein
LGKKRNTGWHTLLRDIRLKGEAFREGGRLWKTAAFRRNYKEPSRERGEGEECRWVVKAGFVSETCYPSHSPPVALFLGKREVALILTDRTIFDVLVLTTHEA